MKTIRELYAEVMADESLRREYMAAEESGREEEFMRAHGCAATAEELAQFIENAGGDDFGGRASGELSDDELDDIAAGRKCGTLYKNGRPRVLPSNMCEKWTCYLCGSGAGKRHDRAKHTISPEDGVNIIVSVKERCSECEHYFGGLCMNPARYNN